MPLEQNSLESGPNKLERIKGFKKISEKFDYLKHLCCIKDKEVSNRVKETEELCKRLEAAKMQIYELSRDNKAHGFKQMSKESIIEVCDDLYNTAKEFEKLALGALRK